jgi:cytochrome b561
VARNQESYGFTARLLHWVIALMVISTIPVGQIMIQDGLARSVQNTLFIYHKNVGVVILLLMLLRLAYRLANPPPPLPDSVSPAQQAIAHLTHWFLYLLVVVMAVSGYVRVVAGGFPLEMLDALGVPRLLEKNKDLANTAKAIHATARYGLVILILMHVGAALFHGIVKRDGVFSRMWPSAR